jgi:hypothetical protein
VFIYASDTFSLMIDYNTNNKPSKISYYDKGDFAVSNYYAYSTLTYNTAGNVIKEVFTDIIPTPTPRYEYVYEYDTKNNFMTPTQLQWLNALWEQGAEGLCYMFSKNNATKITFSDYVNPVEIENLTYTYNADGYPTQFNWDGDIYKLTYTVK